jgi:hypothetical protein
MNEWITIATTNNNYLGYTININMMIINSTSDIIRHHHQEQQHNVTTTKITI